MTRLEMDGSLYSKETAVAIGNTAGKQWPEPTRRWEVPVGDYYPAIVHVRFDNITLAVSNNYHTSAQGQRQGKRETVAGIAIREDKPYVLDFSNKPVVVFEKPNEGWHVGLGGEVEVEAVLVDPVLDIMIRDLDDMANAQKQVYKDADGKEQVFERPASLAPKVFVKRADGEIAGEGVMPFGWAGTCGYSWRVPKDLRLNGDKETFTVEVVYDTQVLYGTVKGQRQIVVYR